MKQFLLFLLLVLPLATQAQKKSAADAKAEQEIRQDLVKQQEAGLNRDFAFYDRLYAPEYFQVTDKGQIRTKAEFLEGMKNNRNEVKMEKYFLKTSRFAYMEILPSLTSLSFNKGAAKRVNSIRAVVLPLCASRWTDAGALSRHIPFAS